MQSLQQIPRCVVLDGLLVLRNGSKHLSYTLRSGCLDLHFFDVLSSIDMLSYGHRRGADIRVASTAPQLASHHRQELARKFVRTFAQCRRFYVIFSCPLLLCRPFAFDPTNHNLACFVCNFGDRRLELVNKRLFRG